MKELIEKFEKETGNEFYVINIDNGDDLYNSNFVEWMAKQLALCNVSEWVAVSKNTPAPGNKVFAITYNDDKVRMIAWGTGDEAFYEYWMVLNIPEPPCR